MKRGSALLLACLMAVGLSTTAFAEEPQTVVNTENGGASISITDITPREEQEDETESSFQTGYYPIAIETAEDAGVRLLVKTFLVPEGTDPQALVEESLTRRGITYQVSDILLRELKGDSQTKPVTKTVTTPAETDDTEELLTLLSPTLEYGEDGYAGTLSLDPSSISAKAADTTSYSYTLKDTREYTGLDRNDPYYIPKSAEKNGVTLTLADVQWTPMASAGDNSEVPSLYKATAVYTGTAWGSKADGYLVTASYTGEATKAEEGQQMVSIVYEETPGVSLFGSFPWQAVLLVLIGAGALTGGIFGVRRLIAKGKDTAENRKSKRVREDPYAGRPPMDLPDLLDEMDRGLEEDR